MKKPTLKQRFSYWFDNKMSGGSLGLIKLLAIVSIVIIALIGAAVFIFSAAEERDVGSAFWDSMATVINAWMPSFEDGSPAYLVLMALAAVVGLFITSVLIGIIASAIEEKITSLRRGNSAVLEEGHTVVLGFYPGEYSLLRQLILAAADDPACIVVAEDMERDEMEQYIADNVKVPKNVRVICRTIDIQDPRMLEKLAIRECSSVIISPTDDRRTTKALLAVSSLISRDEESKVRVGAIMSREEYVFPQSMARQHNVTTLQTYDVIAKMIAHSCTEPGLSETFREVFNFEGSELYLVEIPGAAGLSFSELSGRTEAAVPVGIENDSGIVMNPGADYVIGENDRILVFSEEKDSVRLLSGNRLPEKAKALPRITDDIAEHPGRIVIFGCNETIGTILRELPEGTKDILIAGDCGAYRELIDRERSDRPEFEIQFDTLDMMKEENLLRIAKEAEHVVILSDHEKEAEEADIYNIFLLLHLRDLRERCHFAYNITAEMRLENNQALIENDDKTDFVVASNMSSLILAQLAESPELFDAFRELLSNKGNELYLKEAEAFGCTGTYGVAELRQAALQCGYLFLGYLKKESGESTFNPPLNSKITLEEEDCVIVIGEI